MRTPQQVQAEILGNIPTGFAWPDGDPDTYSAARWMGLADALSQVEGSMEAMLPETDPRSAVALLPDYQRVLGPDPCMVDQSSLTTAQQQQLAFQRWTGAGGNYAGWFIAAAAAIGQGITVTEYGPCECGSAACGDELVPVPVNCSVIVTLPSLGAWDAECGNAECGDPLGSFTTSQVECFFKTWGPLGIDVFFSYVGYPLLLGTGNSLLLSADQPLLLR